MMAKDYLLPALSKLHEHFEESTGFIEQQLEQSDTGEKRLAKETKATITSLIDLEIKELEEMKVKVNQSISKFNQS